MVKFADGGNKKKMQYHNFPWLAAHESDVSDSLAEQLSVLHVVKPGFHSNAIEHSYWLALAFVA